MWYDYNSLTNKEVGNENYHRIGDSGVTSRRLVRALRTAATKGQQ